MSILTRGDTVQWTTGRRSVAMALLCAVGLFNLVDRQVMTILLEPIKKEFGASDTEMGLLTGSVFALCYGFASVPLARLADKYPRSLVICFSLGAWSLLTACGGLAGSFLQLAGTRMGVAIGEAGSGPATYSIMADLFSLRNRAKAFAAYAVATSIGIGAAVMVGGWLVGAVGWRMTLFAMGLPGLILSLLIFFLLRDPVRGMADPHPAPEEDQSYQFVEVLGYLWRVPSYRYAVLVAGFAGCTGYGLLFWGPTFMMRTHGLSSTQAGVYFGSVSIFALVLGQIVTSTLLDIAARHDMRAYMWFAAAGCATAIPFGLVFTLSADWRIALAGFGLLSFCISTNNLGAVIIGQTLVPPRMRATSSMILSLATLIFGSGVAPLLIGGTNDILRPYWGDLAIRYSLSLALVFLALATVAALAAARTIRADYAQLLRRTGPQAG